MTASIVVAARACMSVSEGVFDMPSSNASLPGENAGQASTVLQVLDDVAVHDAHATVNAEPAKK